MQASVRRVPARARRRRGRVGGHDVFYQFSFGERMHTHSSTRTALPIPPPQIWRSENRTLLLFSIYLDFSPALARGNRYLMLSSHRANGQ